MFKFLSKRKTKATVAMMALFTLLMSVAAQAADTLNTTEIISSGVTALSTEIFAVIAVIVPVAFGITAAIIGIRFGIRFVRSLIGR